MDDPTSPLSGSSRRSTWRRLRRAASNENGQSKQERPQKAESVNVDEPSPRAWKRLRRAPSSGERAAATVEVERKEEIIVDEEEEEDVPLVTRRPTFRTTSHSSRTATSTLSSSPPSPATLSASSDSDDDNSCSICLGQPVDAAVLDSCAHSFCFLCIFRWCTDICNNCPLCKRRVTQINHYGDTAKADGSTGGRQVDRGSSQTVVKQEEKRSEEEEERRLEDEEADGAADDWALIQTQRAENQMKQAARRRGRRQGGGLLSQLSLESSPTSLMEGIEVITAIGHSEAAPLTRQMVKQRVAEQQQIIGRSQSNAASPSIRSSSLLSLRHSQFNGTTSAASSTASSPISVSALTSPALLSSSSKASSAAMLVVHIPDRQQRASYDEADGTEEVPSPSILNIACEVCFTDENEHLLLLCDGCDDAYHTYCLRPRLDSIPENEWFCSNCHFEARLQSSTDEQKDVSDLISDSPTHQLPPSITPRRNRTRAQRLGMRVSPAVRQRLTETPQSADTADGDYTPNGGAARFDSTPIPLSFANFRSGYAPRAMHQRRSVRQEQLRRQTLETQRQLQDEQTRLRAERAAKRREDRARLCEDEDELDHDATDQSSPSPIATFSRRATTAPTAPLSSLHQLSSSQNDTLSQRMRDIQMNRLRERDDKREKEAEQLAEDGYIQHLLSVAVQQRDKENGTVDREDGGRKKSKRRVQREQEREEEDDCNGGSGRVRRKAVNRSRTNLPEPIIVPSSTLSSRQPASSIAMMYADSFFPSRSTRPPHTATSVPSVAATSRPPAVSHSPTSSPPSSLSSLPYPSRPAHLSTLRHHSGNSISSAALAALSAGVVMSPTVTNAASVQPSQAVVPPARFPYTAPVIPKRPTSSSPPSSNSSPTTSSWHASSSPLSAAASSVSSTAAFSVPPLQTFEEFERRRSSSHTSRSPFRGSWSPQQQQVRQHKHTTAADKRHSSSDKAALPMRRSIAGVEAATYDSEYMR